MANDSAEKTEAATPRRRSKEREKGNIAKSQDLNSALIITAGVTILSIMSGIIISKLKYILYYAFTHLDPAEISTTDINTILGPYIQICGEILLPFLLFLFVLTVIIIRLQVGNVFAISKLKFDLNNISPQRALQGLKKLLMPFEVKKMVEFVKSLLKLLIVGWCGFSVLNSRKDELYGLLGTEPDVAFLIIGSILSQMIINMCIALIVIGIIDKIYQNYEFEKSIKMTKQEIKDEHKETEGDPKIKSRIRSIQMNMAQQRMMSSIPTADVVVTNPTHYAVALKYDRNVAPAPIVVAKGVDFVAFKIREVAQNNGVPVVENRQVARALYNLVPIDGIIPSDMFVAVAEILAYVYNKNKK